MWSLLLLVTCLVTATRESSAVDEGGGSAAAVYESLLQDFAEWKVKAKPEQASKVGNRKYDDLLTPYEGEDTVDRAQCEEFRRRADMLLGAKPPMVAGMKNYYVRMIRRQCLEYEAGLDLGGHFLPNVAFLRGMQSKLPAFFNHSHAFNLQTEADFALAVHRLKKVPSVLKAIEERLREGVVRGVTFAEESLTRIGDQFQKLEVADPEDSAFYSPFQQMAGLKLQEDFVSQVQDDAKSIIKDEILPGFKSLHEYIQGEYSQHLRSAPGLSNVSNGRAYYQAALEHHTSIVGLTAQEVHDIGLAEVAKLEDGVRNVSLALGYGGNLTTRELFEKVQNDPTQIFDSVEDILTHVRHLIKDIINPKMNKVIPAEYLTEDLYALEVKAASSGIFAWYQEATPSEPKGTVIMNVGDVKAFKKFELLSLLMHEGNPGHHFDLSIFANKHTFPKFIHAPGPGSMDSVPAKTPSYTAFYEGWALYCEFLGNELGLYENPHDLLGFYSWNLLRAARLVVDTGLHSLGWTRQQTVDYLLEKTGVSNYTIQTEVDRYITWPGQATAYKIGERAIRALRQKKEDKLGPTFDLKQFHKHLLPCRGPLDTLEECMERQEELESPEFEYELLADSFFQWKLKQKPEQASLLGHHDFDSELTRFSPASAQQADEDCLKFERQADKVLMRLGNSKPQTSYYAKLIKDQCAGLRTGIEYGGHLLVPITFMRGLQTQLPQHFDKSHFFQLEGEDDYMVALDRLTKVPRLAREAREALEEGVVQNITFPLDSLSRVKEQFNKALAKMEEDVTMSGFYGPFRNMNKQGLDDNFIELAQERAKCLIRGEVMPAFAELRDYILEDYMTHLRTGPGASNLPNGQLFYQKCLELHTTMKGVTAQEVHDIGLQEVKRLTDGVMNISRAMGNANLTMRQFFEKVQEEPEQKFDSAEEVLEYVGHLLNDRINPALENVVPEELLTDKLYAVDVKAAPGGASVAYYNEGAKDGSTNGTYFLGLSNVENFRKFELLSLTLHETNPGHHFDLTVFAAVHDLPSFISAPGFGTHASAPAATPTYTAFVEGWALYAEYLGNEMGLYEDLYDLLGFYSWNLVRAVRLVVDTGLHSLGWTRDKAIEYFTQNTGVVSDLIPRHIDRYITQPGQATAYKMGERAIRALRAKKEEELGDDFDLKTFHKLVLACKGPMDTLEECYSIQEARNDQKSNATK